jgi:hypothetical protein
MKEKRGYKKGSEIVKFMIVVVVFLIIIATVYYFFFYSEECISQECFLENLASCNKAKWINEAAEASWLYDIKGRSLEKCEINVKLLYIKEGEISVSELEGKSMSCSLPLGLITSPEQNLEDCSGELKEDLQDIIIKRMHSYILKNVGEVTDELISPI